ncbi:phosphate propanoyltransferase [Enterococcus sp. 22-H-5-01]|uniref:phosphate propanoyltransferase n=1 Tax=Enterococcus sp. 22-H-5-01 TaxID=3418555 RepID=UPI003D031CB1
MAEFNELVRMFIQTLSEDDQAKGIPLGISNRHIHLSQKDVECLFGKGYALTPFKELSQPGQYACKETVTIVGPKGAIEKVRVLGPVRLDTQVEILSGDCFKLGIKTQIRQSGDIENTSGLTIIGSAGTVILEKGVIIAQRHIHMTPQDAQKFQVNDNQIVQLKLKGLRGGIYDNVVIRINKNFHLECHLDIEEANAMGLTSKSEVFIIR